MQVNTPWSRAQLCRVGMQSQGLPHLAWLGILAGAITVTR